MKKQQTTSEKESRQKERTAELDVKFIDLKRDFAFKWTFGTEGHEELLLMLVDSLLPEKHIRKVSLGTQEQEPDREDAQGGIFDIELFGLGKSDRIIRHFSIREDEGDKDQFTDSIHYVTVELPKFHKSKAELKSKQDYMLYAITNMKEMEEIPEEFLGKGFDKLFEVCRFASMSEDMQMNYVRHMMAKWDREDELATAIMDGEAKGIAKGRAEGEAIGKAQTAKAMKNKDMDPALISELTGLTLEQIQAL